MKLTTAETEIEKYLTLGNYYVAYYRVLNTLGIENLHQTTVDGLKGALEKERIRAAEELKKAKCEFEAQTKTCAIRGNKKECKKAEVKAAPKAEVKADKKECKKAEVKAVPKAEVKAEAQVVKKAEVKAVKKTPKKAPKKAVKKAPKKAAKKAAVQPKKTPNVYPIPNSATAAPMHQNAQGDK